MAKPNLKEAKAPSKPEGTHFLLKRELVQEVYNYLGTRPAQEVLVLMNALQSGAESVTVTPPAPVAAAPAQPEATTSAQVEKKSASKSKKATS